MFCGLEEERTKIRKKKKKGKKKEINLIAAKSGLIGIKGYLKTYNHMKYFLRYFKSFLTETAFYAKLAGRFSGPKIKVTWPIASKFGTNIQLINLKLLSKFHVARQPFSSYKQKSEISHSLVRKWPSKNKGTRDASVGRSNQCFNCVKPVCRCWTVRSVIHRFRISYCSKVPLTWTDLRFTAFKF